MSARMGGAEYQAHQLAEELERRDDVHVTYLAHSVPERTPHLPYVVRKIADDNALNRRAVLFDAIMLWRTLKELRPDVIYQRAKHGYTAICAHYAKRAGIPLVFHAASETDVNGRWRRRWFSTNMPFDLLEVAAGNWGVRRATYVVVQSCRQDVLLRERFGRPALKMVRNFQPIPEALPGKRPTGLRVLWVGNIKQVKRPDLFLELAERFARFQDIEFWMVGRPANYRSMQATMTAIQRSEHVRFLGELPLDEVNTLMDQADVLVNTSSFEGSPNTFIQAWGRGAVVTSLNVDVDGGMETRGIGYCAGDLTRLIEVIDALRLSPQLRAEIAQRAFAHVWQEHSLTNLQDLAQFVLDSAKRQSWTC